MKRKNFGWLGNWTFDLPLHSQLSYQLSYRGAHIIHAKQIFNKAADLGPVLVDLLVLSEPGNLESKKPQSYVYVALKLSLERAETK